MNGNVPQKELKTNDSHDKSIMKCFVFLYLSYIILYTGGELAQW